MLGAVSIAPLEIRLFRMLVVSAAACFARPTTSSMKLRWTVSGPSRCLAMHGRYNVIRTVLFKMSSGNRIKRP